MSVIEFSEDERRIIERLASLVEFREDASGGHIRRVADMVRRISLEIGLDPKVAETFAHAAMLHDIGKIGIPDSLILKPGPLDPREFERVKRHTRIGAALMAGSKCPVLQVAERVARFHHERWNGSGYEGLCGVDIPLEARITAVADVFDALISSRPYKDAWPIRTAMAEIDRLSGIDFDPRVVAAFLAVVTRGELMAVSLCEPVSRSVM